MNKFIKEYKSELLIGLGAVSAIVASVATHEGIEAGICSVAIAIIAIVANMLKEGFSDASVNLIAQAIKIIVDELSKKETPMMASESGAEEATLTIEEIKEKLLEARK